MNITTLRVSFHLKKKTPQCWLGAVKVRWLIVIKLYFQRRWKKNQPHRAPAWPTSSSPPCDGCLRPKSHRRVPLPSRTPRPSKSTCCSTQHSPRPPALALSFLIDKILPSRLPAPPSLPPPAPSLLPDQWGSRSEDEPSARSLSPRRLGGGLCAVTHTGSHVTVK